jgi:hypothetical protein
MKIQVNAHTQDGVWGYMVTVWNCNTCVAQEWFRTMPELPSETGSKDA